MSAHRTVSWRDRLSIFFGLGGADTAPGLQQTVELLTTDTGPKHDQESSAASNVVYPEQLLPSRPDTANTGGGILGTPVLRAFFNEKHFGLGRHNGAALRTREALLLGRSELVAEFRNRLQDVIDDKELHRARLQDTRLETEGICTATTSRLDAAVRFVEQEIELCRAQMELALQEKGWVEQALTKYEMGFRQGLTNALNFDALLRARS